MILLILMLISVLVYAMFKIASERATVSNVKGPSVAESRGCGKDQTIDTGKVVEAVGGGWIINPESPLPLTLLGLTQNQAFEIKRILSDESLQDPYKRRVQLERIVAQSNLRCKEIDEYVAKFKPVYESKIESLKGESLDWATATDKDREDLLEGFRNEAEAALDIVPYTGIHILFNEEPADATIDDKLIERYGYEIIQFYVKHVGKLEKVFTIPVNHPDRKAFEDMWHLGLAIRGEDIAVDSILRTFSLKELNLVSKDLGGQEFTRKAKAIDALIGNPGLKRCLGKQVAFRELFKLVPLPSEYAGIDIHKISSAWRFAAEIAELVEHTYTMGKYSVSQSEAFSGDMSFVTRWELSPIDDQRSCPYCMRAASKAYSSDSPPKVPLHIGCRCTVLARTKYDKD